MRTSFPALSPHDRASLLEKSQKWLNANKIMKSQLIFKIEAILDSGQLNQSNLTHFKIYLID